MLAMCALRTDHKEVSMSKKKMRAFAGAMAVVLAFVPFLSGCAANDAEDLSLIHI